MIEFLLKSTISLAIFLGFYHLILEREKIHQFNRFYLLFSIAISFIIPFLTFEIIKIIHVVQNIEPLNNVITSSSIPENEIQKNNLLKEVNINFIFVILCGLYGIISFILIVRFGKNIWKLISKSKSNSIVKYKNANLVLVDEETLPHTFLNSIFINFEDYNNRNIEEELYSHELVHVNQKHTLDVLFIEFLKVIFWFNPLFIFYKKAIQLNHEFLADAEIVKTYNNVPFYQNLLLQKSSGNQTIYLASNLNYLVTKKRLIMMTKSTSKKIALLKKVAIIPILAGLIYFFCIEVVAKEKTISVNQEAIKKHPEKIFSKTEENNEVTEATYFKGVRFILRDGGENGKTIINKLYEELTTVDKQKLDKFAFYIPKPYQKMSPTLKEMKEFTNTKKYAIWIDGKHVPNENLSKYKPNEIAYFSGSVILKNARSKKFPQPFQYWFSTHKYFEETKMGVQQTKYGGDKVEIWLKI